MTAPKYRGTHPAIRAQLMAVLKPGTPCEQVVKGKRCGLPMWPGAQALDLGHDDHGGYIGMVHASCNRAAGQATGVRNRGRKCRRCGKRYRPISRRQKYCSPGCALTVDTGTSSGREW